MECYHFLECFLHQNIVFYYYFYCYHQWIVVQMGRDEIYSSAVYRSGHITIKLKCRVFSNLFEQKTVLSRIDSTELSTLIFGSSFSVLYSQSWVLLLSESTFTVWSQITKIFRIEFQKVVIALQRKMNKNQKSESNWSDSIQIRLLLE